MFQIEEELKKLPAKPGVYIMHDRDDAIIYVGKAISLRNRVRSYFRESTNKSPKIEKMVTKIARFEYIVTDSELEALVLENNLIKEHNPKYNTMLKDDKTYPYIKVTMGEDFPRVLFSRQMKKDKSRYFGPFTSAFAVKDTIELINKLYKLRTCNRVLPRDIGLERPCLNYHIGQCMAPCQEYVTKEEYRAQVEQALDFLNGNFAPILNSLKQKMEEASENLEFEDEIRYRDLYNSVKQVAQKQKIDVYKRQIGDIVGSGVGNGIKLSVDAPGAEPAGNQNSVHVGEKPVRIFRSYFFRIHPFDPDTDMIGNTAVLECFHHADIGVMKLNIFAYQSNCYLVLRGAQRFHHGLPVGQIRLPVFQSEAVADHIRQMFFFHGERRFIQIFHIQILQNTAAGNVTEQSDLILNALAERNFAAADDDIGLDSHSLKLLDAGLGGFGLSLIHILVPGDTFGCPGYFRMAYCIDTEKVLRSLPALERFVRTEYGR